ncbi:hypothetical protein Tco_0519081 [Tanacetum coccineum]
MEDTLSKFMSESAKRYEENSNLIKEIRATTDAALRNQGASIKTLEIKIEQMSKVLLERGFGSLPNSTETNPRDQVKSISTTIEVDSYSIRRASVSVMPLSTYLNLGLGELAHTRLTVELEDKTVKYPKRIDENVLVDYIELNDLNEPFELRRNQGDDLMPTIEEGEVIEEFRTRDEDLDTGIRFEFTYVNFFLLLYVNVMSKKFHNSIMKDKMVYKGDNVVGALMNVPIFVGTFSVVTDFAILENMDAYRDERMGDVIIGKPFLREVEIKARRFDGMITIYNGNDEVTYQMV